MVFPWWLNRLEVSCDLGWGPFHLGDVSTSEENTMFRFKYLFVSFDGKAAASCPRELVYSKLSRDAVLGTVTLKLLFSSVPGERGFPFPE